jgi:two-component system KDP operon response regulator KdpE
VTLAPAKILIVDDEPEMLALLNEWLEEDGHEVASATNGWDGFDIFLNQKPVLTITDLRMPGMDGFQLISRIRAISDAHVIALTAMDTDEDTVRGFDIGADDYLVKPVSKRVFLARVRSLLRRADSDAKIALGYQDGVISLDFLSHEAQVNGKNLHLRPTEFKLLSFMVQNSDRVLTHQELLDQVWGGKQGSADSLKWYISALREKIEDDPRNPKVIVTFPRVGYRYSPPTTARPTPQTSLREP